MNREINFRGLRIDGKGWVCGDYFYDGFETGCFIREGMNCPPTWDEPGGGYHQEDFEIDPKTLGQYTGLKDRNGVEIYEGDVVRFHVRETGEYAKILNETGVVKCHNLGNMSFGNWKSSFCVDVQVIGNEHEDPDLLK